MAVTYRAVMLTDCEACNILRVPDKPGVESSGALTPICFRAPGGYGRHVGLTKQHEMFAQLADRRG